MREFGRRAIAFVARIGADPADPGELRLRKALLVTVALMVLPAGVIWGALYWVAGEPTAALLPWSYFVGSLVSLAAFHLTSSFAFLRRAQLLLILLVPFLLTPALGGLAASGGVILWSLLAPLGAVTFDSPRRAWRWIVAFLVLLATTTPLSMIVRPTAATLPEGLLLAFLAMNIGAVSLIAGRLERGRGLGALLDAQAEDVRPGVVADDIEVERAPGDLALFGPAAQWPPRGIVLLGGSSHPAEDHRLGAPSSSDHSQPALLGRQPRAPRGQCLPRQALLPRRAGAQGPRGPRHRARSARLSAWQAAATASW
jgi:hypothetical protein